MALQYSTTLRNNQLDQFDTTVDASGAATLEIWSGSPPANCAAADTGTKLATIALGAAGTWMAAASGGSVAKTGAAWQDTSADGTGTAGYFRIKGGTTCHAQGSVGTSGADMIVDNTSFATGQSFTVTSFSITAGNA